VLGRNQFISVLKSPLSLLKMRSLSPLLSCLAVGPALASASTINGQRPLIALSQYQDGSLALSDHSNGHPAYPPRIDYLALKGDDPPSPPPPNMELFPLYVSGPGAERVDLMFLSDGYTPSEELKFLADAKKLTDDIVSPSGAMAHVRDLVNVWAAFVPSNTSGVGTYDTPLPGAAFGLYRPGPELRGVYVHHHKRARAACRYWREKGGLGMEMGLGGCDNAILLGNDPLYGGLGGEFTIITASEKNGPLVLRHELGHSLIEVGEEYEGGMCRLLSC
jgi:hypothetical protein